MALKKIEENNVGNKLHNITFQISTEILLVVNTGEYFLGSPTMLLFSEM